MNQNVLLIKDFGIKSRAPVRELGERVKERGQVRDQVRDEVSDEDFMAKDNQNETDQTITQRLIHTVHSAEREHT